jgi:hypothetical protein
MKAAQDAARVVAAVLDDLGGAAHRAIVVDSPPGAGKSTLVVRAARHLASAGEHLMVVAQTNEQVDDLVDRLATADSELMVGRLASASYRPSARVERHAQVSVATKATDLHGHPVIISTADKWATLNDGAWPWAIVDEAYQMRSDKLLRIAGRFDRALFVGDPGQIDPFSTVETERWTGLPWNPMDSAVTVLRNHNPETPVHRLPVSWRLPASAAPVIAEAFYPFTGFRSGTAEGDRRLELTAGGLRTGYDRTLEMAADSGWAFHELPERHAVRTDRDAVRAIAVLVTRLLQRGPFSHSELGTRPVTPDRIAVGAVHRDQVTAIKMAGVPPEVTVDTANRLQGREYDVTFVLHPLSGRRDATQFHLEAGRLCVLTSRHRHACVVVGRAGIAELLDQHPSTEPVQLNVPVKFPDGWEANQAVLAHLAKYRITAG